MTDQELDRIMRRVLIDSMKPGEERAGEDNSPVFAPSRRHKRRMRAMLANPSGWLRGRERPLWRQAVRRAAVFLVVCGMTLAGVMAFSPAARMAMVRWVVERSGNDIDYVYSGEQSPEALPQYHGAAGGVCGDGAGCSAGIGSGDIRKRERRYSLFGLYLYAPGGADQFRHIGRGCL